MSTKKLKKHLHMLKKNPHAILQICYTVEEKLVINTLLRKT